ncbi:Geranylgeranyl transferase type-2 subunit alpha [Aphelenchoides fujianensis]|nr:Geranylgeranyl transferase type-2 subunit alpha [Aphelenchoides fujianensis]
MHNVKKTPASEAQLAEIKRKRAAALEEFLGHREVILEKRGKNELDEELMAATAEVLKRHPDVYTFWNLRRAAIESMSKKRDDEDEEAHRKRTVELLDAEVELTWMAITTANPKSYSAWYQRGWAIERHPHFDFARELATCEKALAVDHRNFHCWDHRRVVARLARLNDEEELEFSDRLLKNPSNYSAWHYRGSLLQHLSAQKAAGDAGGPPDEQQRHRIDVERLISELQLIQQVCVYNAED